MNFKDKYRANMQQIRPSAKLLADTASLLQAPRPKNTRRWAAAAALSAAALVCAISLPLMQSDDLANQPALLSDAPDIAVYSDSVAVGDFPVEDSQPLGRSAMQSGGVGLTEKLGGSLNPGQFTCVHLAAEYSAFFLPSSIASVGAVTICRDIAQFKFFN